MMTGLDADDVVARCGSPWTWTTVNARASDRSTEDYLIANTSERTVKFILLIGAAAPCLGGDPKHLMMTHTTTRDRRSPARRPPHDGARGLCP